MFNVPSGSEDDPVAPWNEPKPIYCEVCGSDMTQSSLDKDMLMCDNEDCLHQQDISPYDEGDLWNRGEDYDQIQKRRVL